MTPCGCRAQHQNVRIVLTGGPGAGKTAILELVRRSLCEHMAIVQEAAGVIFGGGFPRGEEVAMRRAAQRAIYFVQRELEASAAAQNAAIVLCDRGTVDGLAYWPGPESLWDSVQTTSEIEYARYHAVLHLRTPNAQRYNHDNPLRLETAEQAQAIDARIGDAWAGHPKRFVIDSEADFLGKANRAVAVLRSLMPACCSGHLIAQR